jgi:DNA-binding HxlR family transcriptional regulator
MQLRVRSLWSTTMDWLDADPQNCPVATSIAVVGERWTLLLVRDVLNGIHRFEDFRAHLGVSDAVLADRLRKLVDAGIVERRPYRDAGRRTRNEYHATERGAGLWVVMAALRQWGEEHLGEPDDPAFVARHRGCGGDVHAELRCAAHPDQPLADGEVTVEPGPRAKRADPLLPSRA